MKLLFFDETSDNKFKSYLGICCAVIDLNFYSLLKIKFHEILDKYNWPKDIEFKGVYLFSGSKGAKAINIDTRIEIASELLKLGASKENSRIKFYYYTTESNFQKETYLEKIPEILRKVLKKPTSKKSGKNVCSVSFDHRDDISVNEFRDAIEDVIKEKDYILFEDVLKPVSGYQTVGVLFADIVAYVYSRVDIIQNDADLFENLSEEQLNTNGKILKLKSSTSLLKNIKSFDVVKIKSNRK